MSSMSAKEFTTEEPQEYPTTLSVIHSNIDTVLARSVCGALTDVHHSVTYVFHLKFLVFMHSYRAIQLCISRKLL